MTGAETVQLTSGVIRGEQADGRFSFRGIPYAAPPVGERRWRAPAPVEPWTGVRDAIESGSPAPQQVETHTDLAALDEDCLTLDVTVPETSAGELPEPSGRPVMVWLHGGGGTSGSGGLYDPGRLAEAGDVIVVTPNYRLGILGHFGHPGLADGGTFSLQDQQAVLRWVRREIGRFGGDPDNVTLFGESFGGLAVAAHLAAPGSAGLFQRAILQSAFGVVGGTVPAHTFIPGLPPLPPRWVDVRELERFGADIAAERGWVRPGSDPSSALKQLRGLPVEELLRETGQFIRPAVGGAVLPESPERALRAGDFHRVPVLLGTTRDEARYFVTMFAELVGNAVTDESFGRMAQEAFGEAVAEQVAVRYPLDRYPSPGLAWARVATDRAWALPARDLGQALGTHTRTWFYEFADPEAPAAVPTPVPGFGAGAQHGGELHYLFDLPGMPELTGSQRELADRMRRYWTSFATNGDPATEGLPAWPDLGTGHVQALAPGGIGPTDYVAEHQLDFWAGTC